jgi:hypothetical protein
LTRHLLFAMRCLLIQLLNFTWLFVILVGVPAATRAQFGHWQISSVPAARLAIFWGLGLAAGLNAFGAVKVVRAGRERKKCLEWAMVFGALWLAYFALVRGWINFEWLKRVLLWIQGHL